MARTTDRAVISWPAVSTAVGLLTRYQACPDLDRASVLADCPPDDALAAMEIIASVFAAALSPDDQGARVLQLIGLRVLEEEARR